MRATVGLKGCDMHAPIHEAIANSFSMVWYYNLPDLWWVDLFLDLGAETSACVCVCVCVNKGNKRHKNADQTRTFSSNKLINYNCLCLRMNRAY